MYEDIAPYFYFTFLSLIWSNNLLNASLLARFIAERDEQNIFRFD